MSDREIALGNEVLRGVVGSTALGTAVEGTDDRDEMGVFVEPPEFVCGLTSCDHYIYRDQPEGVRSQAGDLDLTLYSLRKYVRLAAKGNPSVVLLLWLPSHLTMTPLGAELVSMRTGFISRESGQRFLGYMTAQKLRLTGERTRTVNRPELVAKYGYDTKFAMHALRLGMEGIQLLTERQLIIPHHGDILLRLRAVRAGQVSYADVVKMIEEAEQRLKDLINECDLEIDRPAINRFLVRAHHEHWAQVASDEVEEQGFVGHPTKEP